MGGKLARYSCLTGGKLEENPDFSLRRGHFSLKGRPPLAPWIAVETGGQNVPSRMRVAAGAFGFLTLIQLIDGPERYGASSRFETIP
jgi:hypothetical protein